MTKTKSTSLSSIVSYLDRELRVREIADSSNNGLQVQNSGKITKVACGVDASLEFFEAAADIGANLLIVHHGLSWKDSLKRITRLNYKWLSFLINNDMALYASHLPLDAHMKYGNNVLIARALGLKNLKPAGVYHGTKIAVVGNVPGGMAYNGFVKKVKNAIGAEVKEMNFGPKRVRKVFVVSGGGCGSLDAAEEEGADTFVSGEPTLAGRNFLRDAGMNGLFGGHYVTETFGVKALAALVKKKFGLPAEFIDLGIDS